MFKYVFQQVSHHPPVSAFYVSNRKDGFCLSGSILAKSKFYGKFLYYCSQNLLEELEIQLSILMSGIWSHSSLVL